MPSEEAEHFIEKKGCFCPFTGKAQRAGRIMLPGGQDLPGVNAALTKLNDT